ncbi:MAG: hypothetical protein JWQ99_2984 [Blastococcus sp.]|jgi:hypothetical protein|nr:hypothetical protein [Blastococcus sp.]
MPLPRILLLIFDPAGAEMEKGRPSRPRAPMHRGAAVYGPGEPSGGRPATVAEAQVLAASAATHAGRFEESVEALLRRRSVQLEAAADELLRTGSVGLRLGAWEVEARIIRFWHGDSVLEISSRSDAGSRRGRTRIPRDPRRLGREGLTHYLAHAATDD